MIERNKLIFYTDFSDFDSASIHHQTLPQQLQVFKYPLNSTNIDLFESNDRSIEFEYVVYLAAAAAAAALATTIPRARFIAPPMRAHGYIIVLE